MIVSPATMWSMWVAVAPRLDHISEIQFPAIQILNRRGRYDLVEHETGVPWWLVGCIHYRESNFDFKTWLANGDPLFDGHGSGLRTHRVPSGLGPATSWEEGARVSLQNKGWKATDPWDIIHALDAAERWNGLGYRKHGVLSPYLWSMTNLYRAGKYSSDGVFDPNLIDKQAGVAAIAWYLARKCEIDLNEKKP